MTAAFQDQRCINQVDRLPYADAQPQVIIFTGRELLIKTTRPLKQCPTQHHGRGTDETVGEALNKNITVGFSMFIARIDPNSMTNPGFLGLANLRGRLRLKKGDLVSQFLGLPDVVGIEKGEELALTGGYPPIACGGDAPMGLKEVAYGTGPGADIFFDDLSGCVPGRVR